MAAPTALGGTGSAITGGNTAANASGSFPTVTGGVQTNDVYLAVLMSGSTQAYETVQDNNGNAFTFIDGTTSGDLTFEVWWIRVGGTIPTGWTADRGGGGGQLLGRLFGYRGVISTGTPYEDATLGAQSSTATPATESIDTTGADRLAIALCARDDDPPPSSGYPPTSPDWTDDGAASDTTGSDGRVFGISRAIASAGNVPSVNFGTWAAAVFSQSLTLALIPEPGGADLVDLTDDGINVPEALGSPSVVSILVPTGIPVSASPGSQSGVAVSSPSGLAVPISAGDPSGAAVLAPSGLAIPASLTDPVLGGEFTFLFSGIAVPVTLGDLVANDEGASLLDLSDAGIAVTTGLGSPSAAALLAPSGLAVPATLGTFLLHAESSLGGVGDLAVSVAVGTQAAVAVISPGGIDVSEALGALGFTYEATVVPSALVVPVVNGNLSFAIEEALALLGISVQAAAGGGLNLIEELPAGASPTVLYVFFE